MADCPLKLEQVWIGNPSQETWRLSPAPANQCTVTVTLQDGTVIKQSGPVGDGYIDGFAAVGALVFKRVPTNVTFFWEVVCPDCTVQLNHIFTGPSASPPNEVEKSNAIAKGSIVTGAVAAATAAVIGGLLAGPPGAVIGGAGGFLIGFFGLPLIEWIFKKLGIR